MGKGEHVGGDVCLGRAAVGEDDAGGGVGDAIEDAVQAIIEHERVRARAGCLGMDASDEQGEGGKERGRFHGVGYVCGR